MHYHTLKCYRLFRPKISKVKTSFFRDKRIKTTRIKDSDYQKYFCKYYLTNPEINCLISTKSRDTPTGTAAFYLPINPEYATLFIVKTNLTTSVSTHCEKEYVNFGGIIAERVRLEGEHWTIDRYVDIVDGIMLVEGRNHVAAFGLKEGEWLVTLNSEVSLGWIDPRPIPDTAIVNNDQVFQWTAETIGVPVKILLKGPSDKLQEPTDEWLVSLLNENSTEVIKVSPDGRATVFRYVRRTNQ